MKILIALTLLTLLVLAACSQPPPEEVIDPPDPTPTATTPPSIPESTVTPMSPPPTDTPQPTPEPTPTPVPMATPLPTPTFTPGPTATPLPTPTFTLVPTATPIPTPTFIPLPTATPTPTPTPTPRPSSTPTPPPTPTPMPTPEPPQLNAQGLPLCAVDSSFFPPLDFLDVRLYGCHTQRANLYRIASILNRGIDLAIDPLLESLSNALETQLNVDTEANGLPSIHMSDSPDETLTIRKYLGIDGGEGDKRAAWFMSWGDRPGIYVAGSTVGETIAHEYVHFALQDYDAPRWLDEGLAQYYTYHMVSTDPTGHILFDVSCEKKIAGNTAVLSLNDPYINPYSRGYMAVSYIIETYGYPALSKVLELMLERVEVSAAISRVAGKSYGDFEADFTRWVSAWGEDDPKYQDFLSLGDGALFCFEPSCRQIGYSDGKSYSDFSVEATFINPTRADRFKYGFEVREYATVFVTSEQTWEAIGWTPKEVEGGWTHLTDTIIDSGEIGVPFDTSKGGQNHLRMTAVGDQGCLFINGEGISCFDLPAHAIAGHATIISRIGDVWYKGFEVDAH